MMGGGEGKPYQRGHGLTKAREAVREFGTRALDGRTPSRSTMPCTCALLPAGAQSTVESASGVLAGSSSGQSARSSVSSYDARRS